MAGDLETSRGVEADLFFIPGGISLLGRRSGVARCQSRRPLSEVEVREIKHLDMCCCECYRAISGTSGCVHWHTSHYCCWFFSNMFLSFFSTLTVHWCSFRFTGVGLFNLLCAHQGWKPAYVTMKSTETVGWPFWKTKPVVESVCLRC